MKNNIIYALAMGIVLFVGCSKEESFEMSNTPAKGTLQDDASGDCLPKSVNGVYAVGQALVPTTHTITVAVNVTRVGTYSIYTDTVNNYYFRATGKFTSTGLKNVTLNGRGTPFAVGINNFTVYFDSSVCNVQITVTDPATFTLAGSPNTCTNPVISGTYGQGIPLTASNTVTLNINVTKAGSYNITTATVNGMTFSGSGTLATGAQTIVLTGSGTPTTAGNSIISVTAGSSTCSFTIPVAAQGVGTLGGAGGTCTPVTVNGTYSVGTALNNTHTVNVQVNVTTAGIFNISTNTVNGYSFAFLGNLSVGTHTVTLLGSGTPVAAGSNTFTVTVPGTPSSSCTFTVTVQSSISDYYPRTANSNWSYEFDDSPNDSLYRVVLPVTVTKPGGIYNIFMQNDGTGLDSSGYYRKSGGDYIEWIDLGDYLGFEPPAQWAQNPFLKDNLSNNASWSSPQITGTILIPPNTPVTISRRIKYTIVNNNNSISFTTSMGIMNFNNVIQVKEEIEQLIGGNWVSLTPANGYGMAYYARNIGLVKYEFFTGTGTLESKMELRRYQIF